MLRKIYSNHASVTALYKRSGGKNGKHGSVPDADDVNSISNVGLQLHRRIAAQQLSHITVATSITQTKHYALVPSANILMRLSNTPKKTAAGLSLSLLNDSTLISLQNGLSQFDKAIKSLKGRQKNT
jgi:hypothetical protein